MILKAAEMNKPTSIYAVVFCALLALAGCGGGGAETQVTTTTTGQQLSDLKKAYDDGAISAEEYEEQRERILDGE